MPNNILDEMKLPLTNPNEELEDISNNRFVPLFDVTKFEVRKESGRDKGIDFRFDLKRKGKITGFHFVVQLKATEKMEKNRDGSISLTVYTSNINYLLNAGIPAYYVLYFKNADQFLYENLNDFVKDLSLKKSDWENQDSHTLIFRKVLNANSIEKIYNHALDHGIFSRTLNEKLAISSSMVTEKIIADPELNVRSDSDIRRLVEDFGFYLLNESKWTDILTAHQMGSQNIATTAKYNLNVGIAYYYTGDLIKALSHFKAAVKLKTELPIELQEHLLLYEISVRFSLGLISKSEYQNTIQSLEKSNYLRYYIKIDQEKELYLKSSDQDIERGYEKFIKEMNAILIAEDANDNIKLLVRCEMVLFEGSKINMDYARSIAQAKAYEFIVGENRQIRASMIREILQRKFVWIERTDQIKTESANAKNYFVFFHALINETKVNYEFEVYTDLVSFDNTLINASAEERIENLDIKLNNIEQSIEYFRHISHLENLCAALSLKYEILHYKGDVETANGVLTELSVIIEVNEMKELQLKLEHLRNKGTTHERLKAFFSSNLEENKWKQLEYERMVDEMKQLDALDEQRKIDIKDPDIIDLYPIHHFQFPRSERRKVYEILNISSFAQPSFDNILDVIKAIPIANIYNNPINQEGFGDDPLLVNNIEAWRNIYRIRKEFFDRRYPRIILKF